MGSGFRKEGLQEIKIGSDAIVDYSMASNEQISFTVPDVPASIINIKVTQDDATKTVTFVVLNKDGTFPGSTGESGGTLFPNTGPDEKHPTLGSFLITEPKNQIQSNSTPTVRWQGTVNAVGYDLWIGKDKDCKNIILTYLDIKTTEIILEELDQGTYYACVTARDPMGSLAQAANNGWQFMIDLEAPTVQIEKGFGQVINMFSAHPAVIKLGGKDVQEYRFKFGSKMTTECASASGYSFPNPISVDSMIETDLLLEGDYRLCVVGADQAGNYQSFKKATMRDIRKDVTPPMDLVSLTDSGFPTDRSGILATLSFPLDTTDFLRVEVRGATGAAAPMCDAGELIQTVTDFASPKLLSKELVADTVYSLRACVYDESGNVNDQVSIESLVAKQTLTAFVTSGSFNGNLSASFDGKDFASAVDGANYRCQYHANLASLSGHWEAILATGSSSHHWQPSDHLGNFVSLVQTGPGLSIASSKGDLFDNTLAAPINYDESGNIVNGTVWTGSYSSGNGSIYNCGSWTVTSANGTFGDTSATDGTAFSNGNSNCTSLKRLYCVNSAPSPPEAKQLDEIDANFTLADATISLDFPTNTDHYGEVKLYRVAHSGDFHDCTDGFPDSTLIKTYDGTGTPFEDDSVSDVGIPSGEYRYLACVFDNNNQLAWRQFSKLVLPGTPLIVFDTSTTYQGNFGGIAQADIECATHGAVIDGSANWISVLSDSSTDLRDRVLGSGPFFNVAGELLAVDFSDLFTAGNPTNYTKKLDENGTYTGTPAWTGTLSSGLKSGNNCIDWTNNSSGNNGTVGDYWWYLSYSWLSYTTNSCDTARPLRCIQNP
jgi:hypothetical protein